MNKELTKEEAEEFYNKLWLENKELIQENIDKINTEIFELELELVDKDKEIERLKEELKELNEIIEIGRKREYHSKFLKDFQKERGKNVFPDHDEIYKRYDDYKGKVERAIDFLKENACIDEDGGYFCDDLRYDDCKKLLEILKGENNE